MSETSTAAGLVELAFVLHRVLQRRADADFAHPRPPEMQLAALRLVGRRPGMTVRALADELQIQPNNASALVTAMVAAGILRKQPCPDDRRVVRLHLTDEARDRFDEVTALFTTYVETAMAALTPEQRAAIGAAMPALAELAHQIRT